MTRFMKGAMILTIAGIIVKVVGAISKVIVARILGGEGVGLYQMAYSLYQLIISIGAAGIPVALSIMVARKVGQQDIGGARHVFKVVFLAMAMVGTLLSLIFYCSVPYVIEKGFITDTRAEGALLAVAPAIVLVSLLACLRGYFQGFQNMLPTGLSQVAEQMGRVLVMIGAAIYFLPSGIEIASSRAALSSLVGVSLGCIVLAYFYYREPALSKGDYVLPLDKPIHIMKELVTLALPVAIANIMIPLIGAIDLWLVPQQLMKAGYAKEEATAAFGYLTGMATSLISLPVIVTMSLAASLVPAISSLCQKTAGEEIQHRIYTALRMTHIITIPAFVGLCVLAHPISLMMFNTPHAGGAISILSASIWLLGIQQVTAGALQGLGRTDIPMWTILIGSLAKIGLNLWLTPLWGIQGAAWATNIDFALAATLNIYMLYRCTESTFGIGEVKKILLASFAMGGGTMMVFNVLHNFVNLHVSVCLSIGSGILLYILFLGITKAITLEEAQAFPKIGKYLRKVRKYE